MPKPERVREQTQEAREGIKERAPEQTTETLKTSVEQQVGTQVETRGLNKKSLRDVFSGAVSWGKEKLSVFARARGETVKMRPIAPEQARAEQKADGQLDLFLDVFNRDLTSVAKTFKGDKERVDAVMDSLEARAPEIIASAVGTENPEATIIEAIKEGLKENATEITPPTLGELELRYAEISGQADEAYEAENETAYDKAVLEMRALQHSINALRLEHNPNATQAEKDEIADDVEGFVEPLPDAIYDEGYDRVAERIKELEKQMDDAGAKKDATSYVVAEDERRRHLVMLPVLERVKALEETRADAVATFDKALESGMTNRKVELGMKIIQRDTWRKTLEQVTDQLSHMDAVVAEFGVKGLKEGAGQEREDIEARYARTHERLKKLESEIRALQAQRVEIDFDPDNKIFGEKTALFRKLKDLYAENPKEISAYVERALTSTNVSESTKVILEAFQIDSKNGQHFDESPMPEETPEQSAVAEADLEEGRIEVTQEDREQAQADIIRNMKDLREAGHIEEEDDISTWNNTFNEVVYALNQLGLKPQDEGLPASFEGLLDIKDKRGFFGKLIGKETNRVKGFQKLADAHYRYIDSGKVDMTEYLSNAKLRQDAQAQKMRGAGRGTFGV